MIEELTPWEPPVHIYVLRDPITKRIRYVGQTQNPSTRLGRHMMEARPTAQTPKDQWLYSLKQNGQKPELCVVEVGTLSNGPSLEKKWIAHFADAGEPLFNVSHCSLNLPQEPRDGKQRGRPKKTESEMFVFKTIRFPPDLWSALEAVAPPRGRSAIVQEGLRRELARRKRKGTTG